MESDKAKKSNLNPFPRVDESDRTTLPRDFEEGKIFSGLASLAKRLDSNKKL